MITLSDIKTNEQQQQKKTEVVLKRENWNKEIRKLLEENI